jgi:hypothetical protein
MIILHDTMSGCAIVRWACKATMNKESPLLTEGGAKRDIEKVFVCMMEKAKRKQLYKNLASRSHAKEAKVESHVVPRKVAFMNADIKPAVLHYINMGPRCPSKSRCTDSMILILHVLWHMQHSSEMCLCM